MQQKTVEKQGKNGRRGLTLVRPPEYIVDGGAVIIRKADQKLISGFPSSALVTADTVLTEVQIHGYLELRISVLFPQRFQSICQEHHPLTIEYQNGIF